jgi:surface antigen
MILHRRQFLGGVLATGCAAAVPTPLAARGSDYLQCVPYARAQSGVEIYGDAYTWWGQAVGRYARGNAPRAGAVMVFRPHRNMRLGHVACVSAVSDSRTVRLDHANWSVIDGRRGQIERNVLAVDASPDNDWSEVKVWYHPIQALGSTRWPLHGFIYNSAAPAPVLTQSQPRASSRAFDEAFRDGF